MTGLDLEPAPSFRATLAVPGDKSISHRALLFASVAEGVSHLSRVSRADDVETTRAALGRLGVRVREEIGRTLVHGRGWHSLDRAPGELLEIDCGNSGTTARLLAGLLAGRSGSFRLTGDASLSARPMARIAGPLKRLGASVDGGPTLPLTITGGRLSERGERFPVASAQVKGALMLAGLQTDGGLELEETAPMRDHSERLLRAMHAPLRRSVESPAIWLVTGGAPALRPLELTVPGDPSSAAPFIALAAAVPGARLELCGVSLNETRMGFVRLLSRMGARIELRPERGDTVEPGGRLIVCGGELRAIDVTPAQAADAIDELPLLAVLAARARGTTTVRGAAELRVKESDRLAAAARLLTALGAEVAELEDGLIVAGPQRLRGGTLDAGGDHRIAMCAAVAAGLAAGRSRLAGADCVRISYPEFFEDLERVRGSRGARSEGP